MDGPANKQAQMRAMLRDSRPLRMTSQGIDYVSELRQGATDSDAALSERIIGFVMEIISGVVELAADGYRACGRGVVVLEIHDLAWLVRPPAQVPAVYMAEPAVREQIPPDQSREEALRRSESYDPERQVVVVVAYPGGVFSSTLSAQFLIAQATSPGNTDARDSQPA